MNYKVNDTFKLIKKSKPTGLMQEIILTLYVIFRTDENPDFTMLALENEEKNINTLIQQSILIEKLGKIFESDDEFDYFIEELEIQLKKMGGYDINI